MVYANDRNRLRKLAESRRNDGITDEMHQLLTENHVLQENYEAAAAALLAIRAEDEGWAPLRAFQQAHDGWTIAHIHEIYEKAKLQTQGNPLLKQGFTLRSSWVWGRGIELIGEDHKKPRFEKLIKKNERVLFSQSAFTTMERALYNGGNLFMAYRRSTNTAFPIPLKEITSFASNPDRISDVWYYQRTYQKLDPATGQPVKESTVEWYPVWETVNNDTPLLPKIADKPVISDVVIVDVRVNRDEDHVWGVPDVLPAMPYAWAHSEYLRDGSKLLKALSTIAWKVVSKSKGNAAAAGAKLADVKRSGTTAAMTADTDLVAMPRSGQVNLADGDRIAAYVAAALGVSLTALMSTADASGGSYGAEAALEPATMNNVQARQNIWIDFYSRILDVMGMKDQTRFKQVIEDPAYRTLQGLTLAVTSGAIFQDELREKVLEQLDMQNKHGDKLPTPNAFTGAKTTDPDLAAKAQIDLAQKQFEFQKQQADRNFALQQAASNDPNAGSTAPKKIAAGKKPAANDPNPRQGNKGAATLGGDNTNRDAARKPGTSGK